MKGLIPHLIQCIAAKRTRERERKNLTLLEWSQPVRTRVRFGMHGLKPLLAAGWREGRQWGVEELSAFEERFPVEDSHPAREVLREFGGLAIYWSGRGLVIGHVEECHCQSRGVIDSLTGASLYPVGWTNLFEDDGLGVHVDELGRVYVDGATGDDPPKDQRVDLIALNFDDFLRKVFAPGKTGEIGMWYYPLEIAEEAGK